MIPDQSDSNNKLTKSKVFRNVKNSEDRCKEVLENVVKLIESVKEEEIQLIKAQKDIEQLFFVGKDKDILKNNRKYLQQFLEEDIDSEVGNIDKLNLSPQHKLKLAYLIQSGEKPDLGYFNNLNKLKQFQVNQKYSQVQRNDLKQVYQVQCSHLALTKCYISKLDPQVQNQIKIDNLNKQLILYNKQIENKQQKVQDENEQLNFSQNSKNSQQNSFLQTQNFKQVPTFKISKAKRKYSLSVIYNKNHSIQNQNDNKQRISVIQNQNQQKNKQKSIQEILSEVYKPNMQKTKQRRSFNVNQLNTQIAHIFPKSPKREMENQLKTLNEYQAKPTFQQISPRQSKKQPSKISWMYHTKQVQPRNTLQSQSNSNNSNKYIHQYPKRQSFYQTINPFHNTNNRRSSQEEKSTIELKVQ